MRRFLWALAAFVAPLARATELQSNTNVVSAAEDAFGTIVGQESLGLYNAASVRGFSPLTAGNVRLNGLYFDQQGSIIERLVNDTHIRVGLSAVTFPWPAPTGIVDYLLRRLEGNRALTSGFYFGPYRNKEFDFDGHKSFLGGHVGVVAGVSYQSEEDLPGLTSRVTSFGVLPEWTSSRDLTVRVFWGQKSTVNLKSEPIVYLEEGHSAPRVPQQYFGQDWAVSDYSTENYGVLVNARLSARWSLRAGIFRSVYDVPHSVVDLYVKTSSAGLGSHLLIGEPDQFYSSSSGEVRFSYSLTGQSWHQEGIFGLRGRSTRSLYGGGDTANFGIGVVGRPGLLSQPAFAFGPRTVDRIQEYSLEATYSVRWNAYVELAMGMQHPNYQREVVNPGFSGSRTDVRPWLYNWSMIVRPSKRVTLFGALTRGLEDSGVAPPNAINRGAVLGAARSSQREVGLSYSVASSLSLIAAAFDVRKPYFALGANGFFTTIGQERHRGMEFSLSGQVTSGLRLVAGAMYLVPEVTAAGQEVIGRTAVGQPGWIAQFNADYRFSGFPRLSMDFTWAGLGSRMALPDDRVKVPGYAGMDVGMRYRMNVGRLETVLRIQLLNATNYHNWLVGTDGGLQALPPRRARAYLIVDL